MAAVWLLVRTDVRRHRATLAVVAVLVGLVGAVVLTSVAGARRTQSAYPRLKEAIRTSDASVEVGPRYFDAIAGLPEVVEVAPASYFFVAVEGSEDAELVPVAPVDQRFNQVVDRPLILEGRRPDPDAADEILISTKTAELLSVGAGDVITLHSLTADQMELLIGDEDPGAPAGPELEVTVVGIGRTELEAANSEAVLLLTPAFAAAHRDDIGHFDDILQVDLRAGVGVDEFEAAMSEVVPESEGAIVESQVESSADVQETTRTMAASLVVFAIVAGVAGCVALGQALSRHASTSARDQPELRALGLGGRTRFIALALPAVLVAAAGAVLAVVVAAVASPLMPIGVARTAEPDPGFDVDWLVLGVGLLAIVAVVAGCGALAARRESRVGPVPPSTRPGRVGGRMARLGTAPVATIGVSMAVERGRGGANVPVRAALASIVAGVAGLVAAVTFGGALGWVVHEPIAYGQSWDATVVGARSGEGLAGAVSTLTAGDDIGEAAALSVLPVRLGGVPLQAYGLEELDGAGFLTVVDGRAPERDDEVLVGRATLDRLRVRIGDRVRLAGLEGSRARSVRIVGTGVFPEFVHPALPDSDTGAYNDFALLTLAATKGFAEDAGREEFTLGLVRWAPGVRVPAAIDRLEADGVQLARLDRPARFVNLEQVDRLPGAVACFLVVLGLIGLAHVLVMSVRRRGRELAVLQALGFVSSQTRAVIAWQATALAAMGLAIGIPLGLVIGRLAWAVVAVRLGVAVHVPTPWAAIVIAVPAGLLLANLIAALPARDAARRSPAAGLVTE